jgi:hypothetical protein
MNKKLLTSIVLVFLIFITATISQTDVPRWREKLRPSSQGGGVYYSSNTDPDKPVRYNSNSYYGHTYGDEMEAVRIGRFGDEITNAPGGERYVQHDSAYTNSPEVTGRIRRQYGQDSRGIQYNNIGVSSIGVNTLR